MDDLILPYRAMYIRSLIRLKKSKVDSDMGSSVTPQSPIKGIYSTV